MGELFTNWLCMVVTLCFPNIPLPGYIIVGEFLSVHLMLGSGLINTEDTVGI